MMSTTTATLDHALQVNGRLTVGGFCQLTRMLAERHSPAGYLSAQLNSWQDNGCDSAQLKSDIQGALESLLRSLAQRQFRCDGNVEHLQMTLRAITDGTAEQHVRDTIVARVLVDWCENFASIASAVT